MNVLQKQKEFLMERIIKGCKFMQMYTALKFRIEIYVMIINESPKSLKTMKGKNCISI